MNEPITPKYAVVAPLTFTGAGSKGFTYAIPAKIGETGIGALQPGQVVKIPLGRRQSLGVITELIANKPDFPTKLISEVLDLAPLPPHLVTLAAWMSDYYYASPKAVWQTLLPAGIQRKRRAPKKLEKTFELPAQDQQLTDQQQLAYDTIQSSEKTSFLVQGVTGSGKTRLYLELAARQLEAGKSVIVLIPEIALTPQLIALFEASFPGRVVAYHSVLTEAQKHRAWQLALDDEAPLVVMGPRSALFLPLAKPGLIVIDECHETTFKQEQNPKYHAIPVAARLATLTGAQLVLGSATPGLNEVQLAEAGRIELIKLDQRVGGRALPSPTIIDMRDKIARGRNAFISTPLLDALKKTLGQGRQSLLFMNRRGTASSQICDDCGHVSQCPTCFLPLTFHADHMKMICHICNFRRAPAAICPECKHSNLRFLGGGTKRIETEIAALLPDARLARLDKDSANPRELPELYRRLHAGEIDILIGTQMIAKGLDLPHLDTVGVINADTMLHMPDFSASERTFQLLAQVAGRAGRGDAPGRVFIQSRTPKHPAVEMASRGDFWAFAEQELDGRKLMGYPPYRYLLKLTISDNNGDKALKAAHDMHAQLAQESSVKLLGPAPAFHERAGGQYHWHIIVKAAKRSLLVSIAAAMPATWRTDLDPVNLL